LRPIPILFYFLTQRFSLNYLHENVEVVGLNQINIRDMDISISFPQGIVELVDLQGTNLVQGNSFLIDLQGKANLNINSLSNRGTISVHIEGTEVYDNLTGESNYLISPNSYAYIDIPNIGSVEIPVNEYIMSLVDIGIF